VVELGDVARRTPDDARAFAFFTEAAPAHVWAALTDERSTREYLYGIGLSSAWTVNATIDGKHRENSQHQLTGQVLCAWPGRRLSYLLHESSGPPVYLTWLIRPCATGAICCLQIDETDDADSRAELEETWLPVLAALQKLLTARAE
jgi:uncharacterized protein YndB with AHSA1/START domain